MDDDKFLGEPSNPNNSRSLLNNNNSNANNLNSTATGTGHRPSSSSQNKMNLVNTDDFSTYGDGGDDVGWWDCSLCTYKNSADKFKCEICDLRRGTSTRKPRCNADTIVAQVVKQQEQIRQQTRVKTPKSRSSVTGVANPTSAAASSSNESTGKAKSRSRLSDSSKSSRLRPDNDVNTEDESSSDSVSLPEPKKKKTRDSKSTKRSNGKVSKNLKNDDDNSTDSDSTFLSSRSVSRSSLSTGTPTDCASSSSSSSSDSEVAKTSPLPPSKSTQENPLKITPLEVNGNLIKYSPPTSSGRTGLIIDKKRFTQHSVTVNDVTITFTEFATRQNKYIRKKKKRREVTKSKSNNANGKSRGKIDSKSSNQNAPSTASGDA